MGENFLEDVKVELDAESACFGEGAALFVPDHACDAQKVGDDGAGRPVALANLPDAEEGFLAEVIGDMGIVGQAIKEVEEAMLIALVERLEGVDIAEANLGHKGDIRFWIDGWHRHPGFPWPVMSIVAQNDQNIKWGLSVGSK